MNWEEISGSVCPIARTLAVVGDRWTLLILRELAMGNSRFDEIQAQTGMSSFLLSTRLKRLEHDGVVERRQYTDRPPRFEYFATDKGKEFDAILLSMRDWGVRWTPYNEGQPLPLAVVVRATGEAVEPGQRLPAGAFPFRFDECVTAISPAFAHERDLRRDAFFDARRHPRGVDA
ncbi:winged helix-turn-helix transcriptional regulator [Luteibacter aegosomatissinici]|uniref:winged helix-turn-helix transcriptional regulator n=1 Tax=Luteibacter aegosomatissinici TaxID=2911539 RepID=UPI001FFBEFD4|nr:helix-turn-helix domain-containing protein [Luteibacter aegosomatissinici]UPG92715.1 helix-turn-helix transcriptional regulator [Luteibacter aegosomatissinici]